MALTAMGVTGVVTGVEMEVAEVDVEEMEAAAAKQKSQKPRLLSA
jgi:hypothetical protein